METSVGRHDVGVARPVAKALCDDVLQRLDEPRGPVDPRLADQREEPLGWLRLRRALRQEDQVSSAGNLPPLREVPACSVEDKHHVLVRSDVGFGDVGHEHGSRPVGVDGGAGGVDAPTGLQVHEGVAVAPLVPTSRRRLRALASLRPGGTVGGHPAPFASAMAQTSTTASGCASATHRPRSASPPS